MNLGAYELLYEPGQKAVLGPPFLSIDTASFNRSDLRELMAFEYFCQHRLWLQHDVSGLLSPRFTQKTGISAVQVQAFINDNPGYSAYLFHPYPRELRVQSTFLDLAELEHPGIAQALDKIWLGVLGRQRPTVSLPNQQHLCCHCNYILAGPKFWGAYAEFVAGFMRMLRSPGGAFLLQPTPYTLSRTQDAELPMAVFAFERALSHFIADQCSPDDVINYAYAQPSWTAPELFTHEDSITQSLTAACVEKANLKQHATPAYFHYRKTIGLN